jgi:LysR family glycine cleavage system transcriptional activator
LDPQLISAELASGKLVRPLDITTDSQRNYYLVYPEDYEARAAVSIFKNWILQQLNENR